MPLLQWLFLKRGKWHEKDVIHKNMSGLQILNGSLDKGYYQGLSFWIKLLLKGYHKFIYAGNDAHGNFNIYRQIKIPMLSLYEKKEQFLSQCILEEKILPITLAKCLMYNLKEIGLKGKNKDILLTETKYIIQLTNSIK